MEASPLTASDPKLAKKLEALRKRVDDFGEDRPMQGIVVDEDSPPPWAELDADLVSLEDHEFGRSDAEEPPPAAPSPG